MIWQLVDHLYPYPKSQLLLSPCLEVIFFLHPKFQPVICILELRTNWTTEVFENLFVQMTRINANRTYRISSSKYGLQQSVWWCMYRVQLVINSGQWKSMFWFIHVNESIEIIMKSAPIKKYEWNLQQKFYCKRVFSAHNVQRQQPLSAQPHRNLIKNAAPMKDSMHIHAICY